MTIPLLSEAAVTVFFNSIATVIGPTPPGTGVAYDVVSIIFEKSASPTNFPSWRVIATSITIEFFFNHIRR